ncbi:MAG: HNH endonuclease [Saprospiraceae bacterium]|nr:HNH endonuclease [Saprospiraceae bacterium]
MRPAISVSLKRRVAERALFRCEYCRLNEAVSFYSFHIDHIKSSKHGGLSVFQNLAYACPDCNFYKGSDLGTFVKDDEYLIRFFNPRIDEWHVHFEIQDGFIQGKTSIGEATALILRFNDPDRLIFRKELISIFLYP